MRPLADKAIFRGRYSFMLGDANGKPLWKHPIVAENSVVTSGRSWVLKHIMSAQSSAVSSQIMLDIAIGSDTTAPTTANTALGSELVRVAYTTETDNSGSSAPHVIWIASYNTTQGNAAAVSEAALINSSASGTMLSRVTFTTFAKTTSNTLTVSYTFSA